MRQLLERIYGEHRQGLYTLALSIAGSPHRAEDAVHEAFTRLCQRAEKPSGDPVSYVFAAVRNAALDQRRRPGMATVDPQTIFEGSSVSKEEGPEAAAILTERSKIVRDALAQLPEEQRQAVVLRLYSGLTFQQIADMNNEPLSTIASRYRRALDALRETVESLV